MFLSCDPVKNLMFVFFYASGYVSFLLGLLYFMAFVVLSFAPGKGQFYFCQAPVVKINLQGNKSKTPLFEFGPDLTDFSLMQQQLSFLMQPLV